MVDGCDIPADGCGDLGDCGGGGGSGGCDAFDMFMVAEAGEAAGEAACCATHYTKKHPYWALGIGITLVAAAAGGYAFWKHSQNEAERAAHVRVGEETSKLVAVAKEKPQKFMFDESKATYRLVKDKQTEEKGVRIEYDCREDKVLDKAELSLKGAWNMVKTAADPDVKCQVFVNYGPNWSVDNGDQYGWVIRNDGDKRKEDLLRVGGLNKSSKRDLTMLVDKLTSKAMYSR